METAASKEKAAVLEETAALLVHTHEARADKLREDFASVQQTLLKIPTVPVHRVMRLLREYGAGCASRMRTAGEEEPHDAPPAQVARSVKKEEGQ